jgi:hypothetical protein
MEFKIKERENRRERDRKKRNEIHNKYIKKLTRVGNVISDRSNKNVVPFRKIMRGRSLMTLHFKPLNTTIF